MQIFFCPVSVIVNVFCLNKCLNDSANGSGLLASGNVSDALLVPVKFASYRRDRSINADVAAEMNKLDFITKFNWFYPNDLYIYSKLNLPD